MEQNILLVEDSPTCQKIAFSILKQLGVVKVANTCQEAKSHLINEKFNLIFLDLNLPDGSGLELYGEIKNMDSCNQSLFIFVTADSDVTTKVAAFSLGASDYLVKPYSPLELRARAERLLKTFESKSNELYYHSGLCLNSAAYKALELSGEIYVDLGLTPNEFRLLNLFIKNPNRIYSRDQIINAVWGTNVIITERTVDVHISSLRKKLNNHSTCITSVRGEGYRWLDQIRVAA